MLRFLLYGVLCFFGSTLMLARFGVVGPSAGGQFGNQAYVDGTGVGRYVESRFASNGQLARNLALGFLNSHTKVPDGETAERLNTFDPTQLYRLNSFDVSLGYHLGGGLVLAGVLMLNGGGIADGLPREGA